MLCMLLLGQKHAVIGHGQKKHVELLIHKRGAGNTLSDPPREKIEAAILKVPTAPPAKPPADGGSRLAGSKKSGSGNTRGT